MLVSLIAGNRKLILFNFDIGGNLFSSWSDWLQFILSHGRGIVSQEWDIGRDLSIWKTGLSRKIEGTAGS